MDNYIEYKYYSLNIDIRINKISEKNQRHPGSRSIKEKVTKFSFGLIAECDCSY